MGVEILAPIVGIRPVRMLRERLAPQLLGNPERLDRSEARDALVPVSVFGLTGRDPISRNELLNPSRNHGSIVAPRITTLQHSSLVTLPRGVLNGRQAPPSLAPG